MTEQNKQSDTRPSLQHLLAYRFLVEGDLIEATDEFIGNDGQTWARPDGWEVGMRYPSRVFKSARRLVSSPSRDQATGSRPMDEASLPTTSRLSQLEARTSCAASVNVRLKTPSPQPQNNMVETKRLRFLETLQAHLGNANAAIVFELKPSVGSKALPDEQSSSHEDHSIGGKNVGLLEIVISHDASLVVVNPVVELSHAGLQAQSRLRIVETTYKGEGCTKLDLIPQVGVADPPPETHLMGLADPSCDDIVKAGRETDGRCIRHQTSANSGRAENGEPLSPRLSPAPTVRLGAGAPSFQARVQPWMMACFGEMISGDREERNHRFLEEALELVQSTGCTAHEAHQLVDYVYGRDIGEPHQEVGGVMVTLAALCLANALDMHQCGEIELARIWTKVEAIRAKQAAKPKHSPLPGPLLSTSPPEGQP